MKIFLFKALLAVILVFLGAYSYLKLVPIQKFFWLNVAFLVSYWLVCVVFYYVEWFLEKDYFFVVANTSDEKVRDVKNIKVASTIGHFDGIYVLSFEGIKGSKNIKVS